MLRLAEALETAPSDAADLKRAVRANLVAWSRHQTQLTNLLRHSDRVHFVAFSPDGRTAVTASPDGTARLWDAVTGEPRGEPLRHDGGVMQAAFSPDSRHVITASLDRTARLWEVDGGRPMRCTAAAPRAGSFRRLQPRRTDGLDRKQRRHRSNLGGRQPAASGRAAAPQGLGSAGGLPARRECRHHGGPGRQHGPALGSPNRTGDRRADSVLPRAPGQPGGSVVRLLRRRRTDLDHRVVEVGATSVRPGLGRDQRPASAARPCVMTTTSGRWA